MQRTRNSSRRQTLGALAVNTTGVREGTTTTPANTTKNRRQSIDLRTHNHGGPNNKVGTGPPKTRPPRGRSSIIPSVGRENIVPPTPPTIQIQPTLPSSAASHRRQSGIGAGAGGDRRQSMLPPGVSVKPDPRPISDKVYQQECIKKLLLYLQRSGYDHPISHKSLSRPSGKDFTNIITFMLRKVDPTFQDGTLKIEDEIAMNFKAMGYPFTVSKTALVAAGSPHTWPTLLAALTWLMMRIQCMEDFATEEDPSAPGDYESLEELETKMDKYFFKFLSESYTAFLKGDEQLKHDLELRLGERFEHDDAYIMQECDDMTERNGIIVEKMNALDVGGKE
jgi:SMC interacting uncharacterized protein involved in chromosome segregation